MVKNIQAIVLAAGKSSRFNTNKSKLTEKICGREMILYPLKTLEALNISATIVTGYQKEIIQELVESTIKTNLTFIVQEVQKGTGHAVECTQATWQEDNLLILNGDLPLIDQELIQDLYNKHMATNAVFSFVTAHNIDPRPNSYGKVIINGDSVKIVEAKDAQGEMDDCCINAGIYLVNTAFLKKAIHEIKASNATGELYLTALAEIASAQQKTVTTLEVEFDKVRGVNTLEELWIAETLKKSEIIANFMKQGVRFDNPIYTKIDIDVTIDAGTVIEQGVMLQGDTTIGKNCIIKAFSIIQDACIHNNVTVNSHSVIQNSIIHDGAEVGPFALIHSTTTIGKESVIGHFVEAKRSTLGNNSKAKHLTYLGDCQVGNKVNIGAGTITCNFDGHEKHQTIINDNAFIGSNNSLVAPVTIGSNTFTAAGSVITEQVPDNAFAIARSRQTIKENYAPKYKNVIKLDDLDEFEKE